MGFGQPQSKRMNSEVKARCKIAFSATFLNKLGLMGFYVCIYIYIELCVLIYQCINPSIYVEIYIYIYMCMGNGSYSWLLEKARGSLPRFPFLDPVLMTELVVQRHTIY